MATAKKDGACGGEMDGQVSIIDRRSDVAILKHTNHFFFSFLFPLPSSSSSSSSPLLYECGAVLVDVSKR